MFTLWKSSILAKFLGVLMVFLSLTIFFRLVGILYIFCISFQLFNLILCGYRGFAIGVPVQGDGVG